MNQTLRVFVGLEIRSFESPCVLACFLFDVTGRCIIVIMLTATGNGMNLALQCQSVNSMSVGNKDKVAIKNQSVLWII